MQQQINGNQNLIPQIKVLQVNGKVQADYMHYMHVEIYICICASQIGYLDSLYAKFWN